MALKTITKIQDKAEALYQLRREIEDIEERNKIELDGKKALRDQLQEELLKEMKRVGLPSMKVATGDSIIIGKRSGVNIVNEAMAFGWAYENRAVSINKTIVGQLLKEVKEVPPGFELVENEFISVRKAKKAE